MSDEAYEMQKRRAALYIQYQLFTNLAPEKKRVGPFNTHQILYCDLVNIICDQERNELGEDMTVELYTCEGYPLATRPISYISKLSHWCLEEYPDTPLLYAVPRLKCYTDKCTQYMTAAPLCDGTDSIFIRNEECGFSMNQIKTNCTQGTYFQLIKRIQDMTGIPGHLIHLNLGEKLIVSSTDVTLNELNIVNMSALEIKLNEYFWTLGKDTNLTVNECKPTWYQEEGTFGASFFFSCLYTLADWMAENNQESSENNQESSENNQESSENNQESSEILLRTLGHIRSIIGCPPLIHALVLLFLNQFLTLPHRVAIQECLILLFKMIKPTKQKGQSPDLKTIISEKVTEYSNYFWTYLVDYSVPGHTQSEEYSTFKLTCSETFLRMTDPVIVKDFDGEEHIVDQTEVSTKIIVKYLYNYKRMLKCFIEDEVVVWDGTSVTTCGVDLTGEWKNLVKKCKNYLVLCVQAPLNVKSTQCRRPCMIPTASGNIGVYIDSSKDANKPYVYYEVITGQSILFDAQDLDRDVKKNKFLINKFGNDWQTLPTKVKGQGLEVITRDPEEIIMVILDTSASMDWPYMDGKTKSQSVHEAFIAFCDRTIAYDLKHVIGLTLFAKNCCLQYPLSENFREFNDQFGNLPPASDTAIYVGIKFAVEQLNIFTAKYPNYKEVPRRILCLTDGANNYSNFTPTEATRLLINNNIKMDCVLLCTEYVDTHAIAKASGGYSFKPENSQEMLTIFEQETMLTMKTRQHCTAAFLPGKRIKLKTQATRPIDKNPLHLLPEKMVIKVQVADKCLTRALIQKQFTTQTNANLTKRILQELSHYQTNPHPAFEVFPGEEHIDFWRIIMEGPEGTPYEGGIFELFIEFINEYPSKPPNIRFITPIYHCNINSSGRIYHTILDRFYGPGVRIRDIFNYVYGLLIDAEPDDSLDSVKATLLRDDKTKHLYLRNARHHVEKNAKNQTKIDIRIKLVGCEQKVRVEYYAFLICPMTLELFKDPVITRYGDAYEREAIVEHLRSGKNYDPYSYEKLTEDELHPNKTIRDLVAGVKLDIEKGGQI